MRSGRWHCSVVDNNDCEAPAGMRAGSGYAALPGVHRKDLLTCDYCGEPVCKNCSTTVEGRTGVVCLIHSPDEL